MRELAEANAAEVEFFDELHAAGVTPRFRPIRVGFLAYRPIQTLLQRFISEELNSVALRRWHKKA